MRTQLSLLLAGVLVLAGCGSAPVPEPAPTSSAHPAASASPTPTPMTYEIPLVLAVHHSRDSSDIPLTTAEQVVDGGTVTWSELGMTGDAVTVVDDTHPDPIQAIIDDPNTLAVLPATEIDERVRVLTIDGADPLRQPENYPLTHTSETPPGEVITLTVVGDIMLGRRVGSRYEGSLEVVFELFAERLAAADITVGNMESTLSREGNPIQGGDSFAAEPAALDALESAGFDALTLANNHVGDFGREAMLTTFRLVDEAGIARFGAGVNLEEAAAPWVAEVHGTTVAFIGTESIGEAPAATETEPGTNRLNMPPRTPPLDETALERILTDITSASQQYDVVIMMPHWGTQYVYEPEPIQRDIAQQFADAGADLILGGHPHQVQGWDALGDTTVVYSLPNFVFDMEFSRQVQEGMFVEIVLWDDQVLAVEPVPYVIREHIPQPASDEDAQRILTEMRSAGRGPYVNIE